MGFPVRNLMMCECPAFFASALLANNCCHDIAFLLATGRFAGDSTGAPSGTVRGVEAAQLIARLNWGWGRLAVRIRAWLAGTGEIPSCLIEGNACERR